ncbi:hypothetical protein L249_8046 [Ophiocordyceps polyrhachis-furcata BCC 54312]|uniref:Carrier domain-containing protein n=1 Tax=Ophiocordyceps polyrhachis-furcata BCC 54312 TaxID=1330021 RepID=A0A367LIA6_9HYPO|nr:hypothetical protein L249_8046 [Ophiocordyceps polyrhachis-furcata BCC 54312]
MTQTETYIFLFGDQTENYRSLLNSLLRLKPDALLESFLSASYSRLRAEMLQHNHVPPSFSSLLELLTVFSLPPSQQVALDHGLCSICHFALFLHHLAQRHGGLFPVPNSHHLGLCTGSLAASAVQACKTPLELLSVSVQVCVLSYRLGLYAGETAARYDPLREPCRSWAVAVPGLGLYDALDAIDRFVDPIVGNHHNKPYVGVVGDGATTIYGPPSILERFHKQVKTTVLPLPVWAPYHAPHIYDSAAAERLLDGFQFDNSEVRDKLLNAIRTILVHRLDFSQLVSALKHHLLPSQEAVLIALATSTGQPLRRHLSIRLAEAIIIQPRPDHHHHHHHLLQSQYSNRCDIAIVGVSCRLPEADNVQDFWRLVYQGRDVHRVVPHTRWDAATHVDTSHSPKKNTSRTPYGCWLGDAGLFDAGFFGMTPRECEQVDPAQRLALLTAYEALEDGGIVPGMGAATQRDRVGVCYGVTSNDWMETNSSQDIDAHFIPGGNRAFIPGRISYSLKVSGPSLSVDTACSSSAAAVHAACNLLWQGEADTVIAGGTNLLTNPDFTAGLDRGRFLSRTGNCRTFDDEADGYCRVVALILKRLPDAIADRDDIKALIVNVTSNHSAEAASLTRPSLQAQRDILTRTLNGLSPDLVSYVEMHGTGTQIGDATEMNGLLHVLAPPKQNRSSSGEILHLGSVKANVGHGEAVAAATGLVKILSMMQHDTIPPHIGIKTRLNRSFPSDLTSNQGGVRIPSSPVKWSASKPRYAVLNSFNAAGGNTTLLLRDGPKMDREQECDDARGSYPVVISAKSATALSRNVEALASHLRGNPDISLPSLSYTTTARRMHYPFRTAFSVSSVRQLVSGLKSGDRVQVSRRLKSPPVVFTFTGQGSRDLGAARDAYAFLPRVVKASIEEHDAMVRRAGFASFLPLLTRSSNQGTTETKTSTTTTTTFQLAILSLQMALTKLWLSWGVHPVGVMGHSLGHYGALAAAGVISEADAIFLVGARARLVENMCRAGTHKMLCARISEAESTTLIKGCDVPSVEIACINGPTDVVLSGGRCDIDLIHSRLVAEGIPCRLLDVDYAFHSSQMDSVLDDFASAISGIQIHHPSRIPVIVSDGRVASDLVSHTRQRVDVVSALESGKRQGLVTDGTIFLELGHASTVTAMVKAILGESTAAFPTLTRNKEAWNTVSHAVARMYEAGLDIRWDRYHDEFCPRVLSLPHYKWDLRNYWIPYKNSWSLYKGDAESLSTTKTTTTIHKVIDNQLPKSLTLLTDLTSPAIRTIVQGHRVNGVSLVTPSFYVDIALSAGHHHLQTTPDFSFIQDHQPCIREMTIVKALIPSQKSHIRTEISIESDNLKHLSFVFFSVDQDVKTAHARCSLHYGSIPPIERLESLRSEAELQIEKLNFGLEAGTGYRFNKTMVYRMVAVLADFDACYKGLDTVVLDSDAMEASAVVTLPSLDTSFDIHPAHLDALMQLPGFVMNANDASDPGATAFVNHGWDGLMLFEALRPAVVYRLFVRMERRGEDNVWKGNMTVVSGQRTVALVEGITPSVSIFDRFRTLAELKRGFARRKDDDDSSSDQVNDDLDTKNQPVFSPPKQTLFLLPDGSGSSTSYSALCPLLQSHHRLIALSSPHKHDPKAMLSLPLDDLIESYISEIQLRQPHGPYLLGGWSSGGILAYRAAQMLMLRNLTDFGPAGWGELVPGGSLVTHVIEGFDHFGIMKGEGARALAAWLEEVLAQIGGDGSLAGICGL